VVKHKKIFCIDIIAKISYIDIKQLKKGGVFMDYGDYPAAGAAGMATGLIIIYLIIGILMLISMWKIYAKAGKPGWAAIIPIYNIIVLLEIVDKPLWWIILMFIPFVNIVISIIVTVELAKKFGQSVGFAIGMILLSIIFYPILAFGSSTYKG